MMAHEKIPWVETTMGQVARYESRGSRIQSSASLLQK